MPSQYFARYLRLDNDVSMMVGVSGYVPEMVGFYTLDTVSMPDTAQLSEFFVWPNAMFSRIPAVRSPFKSNNANSAHNVEGDVV
jgi:hypothetical protein